MHHPTRVQSDDGPSDVGTAASPTASPQVRRNWELHRDAFASSHRAGAAGNALVADQALALLAAKFPETAIPGFGAQWDVRDSNVASSGRYNQFSIRIPQPRVQAASMVSCTVLPASSLA